jgi:hypothetical protein
MNKYGSIEKTFWARNIYQGAFPGVMPADLVIAAADWKPQLFINKLSTIDSIGINTNIFIKNIGLFCNFSDGLVFKSYTDVMDFKVFGFIANPRVPAVTGTLAVSPASKTTTAGAGFAGLAAGSIIKAGNYFYIVDTVNGGGTSITLTDFPKVTQAAGTAWAEWSALSPFFTITISDLRVLNTFMPLERSISPANVVTPASLTSSSVLMLRIDEINDLTGADAHDINFLTKSVDPAFASDVVTIDAGITIEYTPS